MSLRENELSRSRHAQRQPHKKPRRRNKRRAATSERHPPLPHRLINDDQVLDFKTWCALNAFSERTGRRVLKSAAGPIVTMMSAKRIGITVANNRAWQQSRARA
jgi:hypothetical protein